MSYQGAGAVVAGPGVVLLIAGGIVVGTGILVGKGIMWCHDKLEENYRSACQSYTTLKEQAEAEVRGTTADRQMRLAAYIERNAALAMDDVDDANAIPGAGVMDPAVTRALQEAREALAAAQQPTLDYQTEVERRQLANEIAASEGVASPSAIDAAKATLAAQGGSATQMRAASEALRNAVKAIADGQVQQRQQAKLAEITIADARRELRTARSLLAQSGATADAQAQLQVIARQLTEAEGIRGQNAEAALEAAREALQSARQQVYSATRAVTQRWSKRRGYFDEMSGQLDALQAVVSDLSIGRLATPVQISGFQGEIANLLAQVAQAQRDDLRDADTNEAMREGINGALADLKRRLFAQSDATQQRHIGDQIAATLAELGFVAVEDDALAPQVKPLDTSLRIAARRVEQPADAGRQEHLVYFTVDAQGHTWFDFSGYEGNECTKEAARVFNALRRHGVLLMDAARLAELNSQGATAEMLEREEYAPELRVNKAQPLIQQAMYDVLVNRMGFTQVDRSSSGGVIEMDAHNGMGHRYHTEVKPSGEALVLRDDQDVTNDATDAVAVAARAVPPSLTASQDDEDEQVVVTPPTRSWESTGGRAQSN